MAQVVLAKKTERLQLSLEPARFQEALDWLWERTPMLADEYYALSKRAADRAFTISNSADVDLVASVLRDIDKALATGESVQGFTERVRDKLEAAWGGSVANPGHRIETIYRTNIQSAFSRGRQAQLDQPMVKKLRPLREFDAVSDRRTSAICEECNGTVVDADDPWLDSHTPPLHHQCRSKIRAHRASQRRLSQTKPSVVPSGGFGGRPGGPKDVLQPLMLDTTKLDPELAAMALQKEEKRKGAKPKPVTERKPKGPEGPGLKNGKMLTDSVDAPVFDDSERVANATANEPQIQQFIPRRPIEERPLTADQKARAQAMRGDDTTLSTDKLFEQEGQPGGYISGREARDLMEHGKQSMGKCDQPMRDAATAFSDGFDTTIRDLNSGTKLPDAIKNRAAGAGESIEEATEHMKEALVHRENLERMFYMADDCPVKVSYRGIHSIDDDLLDRFLTDDEFDMQGKHSSSSVQASVAQSFIDMGDRKTKNALVLKLHRKSKGPYIETVSDFGGELEIVIHGNTRWRIIKRTRLEPVDYGRQGIVEQRWLIEAEEVV